MKFSKITMFLIILVVSSAFIGCSAKDQSIDSKEQEKTRQHQQEYEDDADQDLERVR